MKVIYLFKAFTKVKKKRMTKGEGGKFRQQKDISLKIESDESQIILVLGDAKILHIFPNKKMLKGARVRKKKFSNFRRQRGRNKGYTHTKTFFV